MIVSRKKYDELVLNLSMCQMALHERCVVIDRMQKRLQEFGFKIFNQRKEISRLNKVIKELKIEKNS